MGLRICVTDKHVDAPGPQLHLECRCQFPWVPPMPTNVLLCSISSLNNKLQGDTHPRFYNMGTRL